LLYAKGGYAWTETDYHSTFLVFPGPFDGGGNVSREGWVVGGGLEYMFAPSWSAKVEYDYYDFGSKTAATDSGGRLHLLTDKDSKLTAQTLKVGVDYHFGWEARPSRKTDLSKSLQSSSPGIVRGFFASSELDFAAAQQRSPILRHASVKLARTSAPRRASAHCCSSASAPLRGSTGRTSRRKSGTRSSRSERKITFFAALCR
jgi:hypothetical protein